MSFTVIAPYTVFVAVADSVENCAAVKLTDATIVLKSVRLVGEPTAAGPK